jgi:hypothetical protein
VLKGCVHPSFSSDSPADRLVTTANHGGATDQPPLPDFHASLGCHRPCTGPISRINKPDFFFCQTAERRPERKATNPNVRRSPGKARWKVIVVNSDIWRSIRLWDLTDSPQSRLFGLHCCGVVCAGNDSPQRWPKSQFFMTVWRAVPGTGFRFEKSLDQRNIFGTQRAALV